MQSFCSFLIPQAATFRHRNVLSEASFIVKMTLILQVNSSNLPLPAEWNYAEEKYVKEECQKFREEILKIARAFYFTESWKMFARGT